jgi:uncharacterized protein with GYD domain
MWFYNSTEQPEYRRKTAGRITVVTYVVLANFTDQGIRNAKDSPKRAEAFKQMANTFGVTVKELFWTQGRYDIVTVVEAPDEFSVMALSLSLGALGNIRSESMRAFSATDMKEIIGKML